MPAARRMGRKNRVWAPRSAVRAEGSARASILVAVTLVLGLAMAVTSAGPAGASKVSSKVKAEEHQAKKDLLVRSDFPKGWVSSSSSSGGGGSIPGAAQVATCIGVATSVLKNNTPTVYSPEFSSKNQLETASDNVTIYPSAKAAQENFKSLANAKTPNCMADVFNGSAKAALQNSFGKGAVMGAVTAGRLPAGDLAPHTADLILYFPLTEQGTTVNIQLTETAYVKGTLEQSLMLLGIETAFPASLSKHISTVADGRLRS
jgi:hypothetical protein